jgi:HEAT repeat protein
MENTNQLIRILENEEAERKERRDAALTLGREQERDGLDALLKALKSDSKELKLSAIWALGEIGHNSSFKSLKNIYYQEQDTEIQIEILKALERVFDYGTREDFISILRNSLETDDPEPRKYCVSIVGKHSLEELSEKLKNIFEEENDSEVKALIVYSLGEILERRKRLEFLADASKSTGIVRQTAEQELKNTKFYGNWIEESEEWLSEQLEHENQYVRSTAIKALSKTENQDEKLWKIALKDDSEQVRCLALKRLDLSKILDRRKISQRELSFFADSSSAEVRKEIAAKIRHNFLKSGEDVLLELLDDGDSEVRKEAVEALRTLEEDKFPTKRYINWSVRLQYDSIKDFGKSFDQEIVSRILDRLHKEEDRNVLLSIIYLLGLSGEQQAFEPIRKLYGQNYSVEVRKASIEALGQIGKNTEELENFLYDELEERTDPELRQKLLETLGNIKNEETVDFLTDILKEDISEDTERVVLNALANINTEKAKKIVEEIEEEESEISDYMEYQNDKIYHHLSNLAAGAGSFYHQNKRNFERTLSRRTWSIRKKIPRNPITTFLKKATLKLLEISFNLLLFLIALIIFVLVVGTILNILF